MTFSERYSVEKNLLSEIEKEKGFTWNRLFNILALNALVTNNKPLY